MPVITGAGAIGPGFSSLWELKTFLAHGTGACRPIDRFDTTQFRTKLAYQLSVSQLDQLCWSSDMTCLIGLYGRTAWREASQGSGQCGRLYLATAVANSAAMERHHGALVRFVQSHSPEVLEPNFAPVSFSLPASEVFVGESGRPVVVATGCTAGLDAVGIAFRAIQNGLDSCAVVAAEAPITPLVVAAFDQIKALTKETRDEKRASVPFTAGRSGFCLGEGAASVVIESAKGAKRFGRRPLARILSYVTSSSAFHMTAIHSSGEIIARICERALLASGLKASDIGLISVHGTSTPQNDAAEYNALKAVLGERLPSVPIFAGKAYFGHALGAASLLEIAALLTLRERGELPAAPMTMWESEYDLFVPREATRLATPIVLKIASGFSGIHSCMLLELCS